MQVKPRFFPILGLILILSLSLSAQDKPFPLLFQHTQYDFGTIGEQGGPVYHTYLFVNQSADTVWIEKTSANCHCTTGDFPKEAIPPKGTGSIRLTYDPKGRPWEFETGLDVVLKKRQGFFELKAKGKAIGGAQTIRFVPAEFLQRFQYNEKSIESADVDFKAFVEKLVPLLEKHSDIKVQIESSASHVPTKSFANNKDLTAQRARDARNKMLEIFTLFKADLSRIIFQDDITLVQGPPYVSDYKKNIAKYQPFQYVKIRVF